MDKFLQFVTREISLKVEIFKDGELLVRSVNFLQDKMEEKILEIERADAQYRYEEAELLRGQLQSLLGRLQRESRNLDSYLLKYQGLIQHEKEELLRSIGKKEQVSVWGVPPQSGRLQTGQSLQAEAQGYPSSGLCCQVI